MLFPDEASGLKKAVSESDYFAMFTLLKKEISNFLSSLIGYIVICVFLTAIGLFMWVFPSAGGQFNVLDAGYANIDTLFVIAPWVFMFLVPAVTMRSFSEEKRTGTIEILLTRPLTDWQIIFAKYLAGLLLVVFSIIPTLIYFISVQKLSSFSSGEVSDYDLVLKIILIIVSFFAILQLLFVFIKYRIEIKSNAVLDVYKIVSLINKTLITILCIIGVFLYFISIRGNIDTGGMWGSYLGLLFLAGGFVAIGVFASSVTDSQIVAFILAVFFCFFSFIGFESISSLDLFGSLDAFILKLGINEHYISMSRGVIDTRDVLYFVSLTGVFLLFTKAVLESRKWS